MTSKITRLAFASVALLSLGSSVMAGPGPMPMYAMFHGKMVMVTPMTEDVTCKTCKVGMDGMVTMKNGKTMMLKEGEMITSAGKLMKPESQKAHGG